MMVVATTETWRNMDCVRVRVYGAYCRKSVHKYIMFHAENKRTSSQTKECTPCTYQHNDSGRQDNNAQIQTWTSRALLAWRVIHNEWTTGWRRNSSDTEEGTAATHAGRRSTVATAESASVITKLRLHQLARTRNLFFFSNCTFFQVFEPPPDV